MTNTEYQFTLNLKNLFEKELNDINGYYCREDFEYALSLYDKKTEDNIKFVERDLNRMCKAAGIEAEDLIKDRTLLNKILTREQMVDKLLEAFYEMYKAIPTTTTIMERIVRNLAPQYQNDPIRVAILKTFMMNAGENCKTLRVESFFEWAKNQLSEEQHKQINGLSQEKQKLLLISKINDDIFELCESVELDATNIIRLIDKKIKTYREQKGIVFETIELSKATLDQLKGLMDKLKIGYEGLSSEEIIEKLVETLDNKIITNDQLVENKEIIEAVEKEFRNQLKGIKRIDQKGNISDMDVLYNQAKKDQRDKLKLADTIYNVELLQMCNDLAKGNFKGNGITRKNLYYFALMFDMKMPMEGKACPPEKDIVKNLFHDYYNDNIKRFILDDYLDTSKNSSYEKFPTGEGINFKNYVEAIYLYFICHDELKMLPGQKIDKAEALIEECVKRAKKQEYSQNNTKKLLELLYTQEYRNQFHVLLNKPINEIVEFVINNYKITKTKNSESSRIMISSDEHSAAKTLKELVDDVDEYDTEDNLAQEFKDLYQRKEFQNDINYNSNTISWQISSLLKEKYGNDALFMRLIDELDNRIHIRNGRFNRRARERIMKVLNILSEESSIYNSLSLEMIKSRIENNGFGIKESQVTKAIKILINLGYNIKAETTQGKTKKYYLDKSGIDDILQELLYDVKQIKYANNESINNKFLKVLIHKGVIGKRITRSELISLYLSLYINLLEASATMDNYDNLFSDGIDDDLLKASATMDNFTDIFEDYKENVDILLEESRYQKFSEKNLFDMYVIVELFVFFLINYNINSDD